MNKDAVIVSHLAAYENAMEKHPKAHAHFTLYDLYRAPFVRAPTGGFSAAELRPALRFLRCSTRLSTAAVELATAKRRMAGWYPRGKMGCSQCQCGGLCKPLANRPNKPHTGSAPLSQEPPIMRPPVDTDPPGGPYAPLCKHPPSQQSDLAISERTLVLPSKRQGFHTRTPWPRMVHMVHPSVAAVQSGAVQVETWHQLVLNKSTPVLVQLGHYWPITIQDLGVTVKGQWVTFMVPQMRQADVFGEPLLYRPREGDALAGIVVQAASRPFLWTPLLPVTDDEGMADNKRTNVGRTRSPMAFVLLDARVGWHVVRGTRLWCLDQNGGGRPQRARGGRAGSPESCLGRNGGGGGGTVLVAAPTGVEEQHGAGADTVS
ncbi:hypothetical protein BJV74DRAFT_990406 [Russula compacta]|nr:hypothetical protein BJV74DRAFT_990406 [Russula compacta]